MSSKDSDAGAERESDAAAGNSEDASPLAEVPEDSSISHGGLKHALRKCWPTVLIVGTVLFFLLTYIHDRRCVSSYGPALVVSQALADEYSFEAGKVVPDTSGAAGMWKVDSAEALPGARTLLKTSGITVILDEQDFPITTLDSGDLPQLQRAFADVRSASRAVRKVAHILSSDAGDPVSQAAVAMQHVHNELKKNNRQPFLFGSEPLFVAEFRELGRKELDRFKDKVDQLRTEAGYVSSDNPIVWDSEKPLEQRDRLIPLTEEACRYSRCSFVLVLGICSASSSDAYLRDEFLQLQDVAWQITSKLVQDAKSRGLTPDVHDALERYSKSMARRIRSINGGG